MKKQTQPKTPETKERIPVWLYPSTIGDMDKVMPFDNCKSRSEYIEKALRFYNGYALSKDSSTFLSHTLASMIRGTMQDSENRMARLLFKLAVEVSMMTHVLASGVEISDAELSRLRGKCVDEVKRNSGRVTFDDAVKFQSGE